MKRFMFAALFAIILIANIFVDAQVRDNSRTSCGTSTVQKIDLPFTYSDLVPASEILLYIRFEATTVFRGNDDAGIFRSSLVGGTRNLTAPNLSTEQKNEIVQRVKSDFSPFNIRITTDLNEFLAYPADLREMAIVTTTPALAGFSNGVAGVSPFAGVRIPNALNLTFSSVLGNNPIDVAATISHETGHIFGLDHQNFFTSSCGILNEYHPGFGSGSLKFNPIMGNGTGDSIYNWFAQSCPSLRIGLPQDDFAKINLSVETRPDDFPNTPQSGNPITESRRIAGLNEVIGVLEQSNDADVILVNFNIPHNVTISSHNIDLKVSLMSESGQVLGVFSDPLERNIIIPQIVGPKYLKLEAESNANMSSQFMTGTYKVVSVGPSAANSSISGRVTTASGRGIRNVVVQISGGNLSETKYTRTNPFGYYRFSELESGQTYVLNVASKRYSFANPTRVISLNEDLTGEDFVSDGK